MAFINITTKTDSVAKLAAIAAQGIPVNELVMASDINALVGGVNTVKRITELMAMPYSQLLELDGLIDFGVISTTVKAHINALAEPVALDRDVPSIIKATTGGRVLVYLFDGPSGSYGTGGLTINDNHLQLLHELTTAVNVLSIYGTIDVDGNEVTVSGFAAKFGDIVVTQSPATFTSLIGNAATAHYRIDRLEMAATGVVSIKVGNESTGFAVAPDPTPGTVTLDLIPVFGDVITVPTGEYVSQASYHANYIVGSGVLDNLSYNGRLRYVISGTVTEIRGFEVSDTIDSLTPPNEGRLFVIENRTSGTITLPHLNGAASQKLWFPNLGNFLLPANYLAAFYWDSAAERMVFSYSNKMGGGAPTFAYDPITGQVSADGTPAFIISNYVPVIKQEGPVSDLSTHTTTNINTFRGRLVQNSGVLKSIKVWCTQVGAINFRILSKNSAGTYNIEHFFSHTATAVGLIELTAGTHFPDGIDIVKDWVIGVHSTSSTGAIGTKTATETLMSVGGDPTGVHQALSTTTVLSLGLSFTVMYYDDKIQIERLRKKADTVIEMVPGSNLFDKTRVILNWVHDNATGKLTFISGRGTTYKIPVKPSQLYFIGGGQVNYGIAVFFTASMQYISSSVLGSSDGAGFTTPATAAYVAINFANASASTFVNTLKLNEGSVKPYEAYAESYAIKLSAMPAGYSPGGGVEYDQSLNSDDEVEFALVKTGGLELDLPTSPSGLGSGRIWVDTANGNVLKVVS